ncbi:MAG: ferredoxin family protein [Candidatus Micrarchaeia archaeon]
MTVVIDSNKCTLCAKCVNLCPGNLLYFENAEGRVVRITSDAECWDCMVCVKVCPVQAIKTKLPFQLANRGATLLPKVLDGKIQWTLTYPDGRREVFKVKTKTK